MNSVELQHILPSCPVCGEEKRGDLDYGGYAFAGALLPLVRCVRCSLKYIDYRLSDAERTSLYEERAYFESAYAGGGGDGSYFENESQQNTKADAALAIIRRFEKEGALLEIGSAGGLFLLRARQAGFRVSGVEMSQEMAEKARALGLAVFAGELKDAPRGDLADAVYMGDVLEHVPDPLVFLSEVKKRMAPGGVLALEVPLTYNLTLSGIAIGLSHALRGRFGFKYFLPAQHRGRFIADKPYHLLFFNSSSLQELMRRAGFAVRYLRVYEGPPKLKFAGAYRLLKGLGHLITSMIPQRILGDRAFLVASLEE